MTDEDPITVREMFDRQFDELARRYRVTFMEYDPERIDDVLDELERYWKKHPDLRLGQIVVNAASSELRQWTEGHADPFYMEDDTLLHYLEQENE